MSLSFFRRISWRSFNTFCCSRNISLALEEDMKTYSICSKLKKSSAAGIALLAPNPTDEHNSEHTLPWYSFQVFLHWHLHTHHWLQKLHHTLAYVHNLWCQVASQRLPAKIYLESAVALSSVAWVYPTNLSCIIPWWTYCRIIDNCSFLEISLLSSAVIM